MLYSFKSLNIHGQPETNIETESIQALQLKLRMTFVYDFLIHICRFCHEDLSIVVPSQFLPHSFRCHMDIDKSLLV